MARDKELIPDAVLNRGGVKVSKSPWGPRDEIGRLNWVTRQTTRTILDHLDGRHMFDLNVEYFIGMPSWVAADVLPDGYAITPKDLQAAVKRQKVELRKGDVVLVRTGRMRVWPDFSGYLENTPGIGLDAAKWLCEEAGAMCIGADTIALEVLPSEEPDVFLPVHAYMFSTAGAQIIEVVDMEEIAAEKQYEFAFLGFPMKLRGATGAPMPSYAVPLRD